MAVITKLGTDSTSSATTTVYGILGAVTTASAGLSTDQKDTLAKIVAYLKNNRGLLSEILVSTTTTPGSAFSANDGAGGVADAVVLDHL